MEPLPIVPAFSTRRKRNAAAPPAERKPKDLHQMFVDRTSKDSEQVLKWLKQHKKELSQLLVEFKLLSEKGDAESCCWSMRTLTQVLTELSDRVGRKEEWRQVMSQQIAWLCLPFKTEAAQRDLSADDKKVLKNASDLLYKWTQLSWLDQDEVVAWVGQHNVAVLSDMLQRRLDSSSMNRHKRRKCESDHTKQSLGAVDPELLTQRLGELLSTQEQEASQQQYDSDAMRYSPTAYSETEPAYSPTSPAYSPSRGVQQAQANDDVDDPFSPAVSGLASPLAYDHTDYGDNAAYSPLAAGASEMTDDDVPVYASAAVDAVDDAVMTPVQSPSADSDDSIILDVQPTAAELLTVDACSLIRHVAAACGYGHKEMGAAMNFFHHFQVHNIHFHVI
jgi:hypothetical protein